MSCNMLFRLCYLLFFLIFIVCINDFIEVDDNNGNEDNNLLVLDLILVIESIF